MKIGIFTDPHLGKNLGAHTTAASRQALKSALFEQALSLFDMGDVEEWFCLGDLFDKYKNDERTLLQGLAIVQRCTHVMAGNHDVVNDATKVGTLQALQAIVDEAEETVLIQPFGGFGHSLVVTPGTEFYFVPHHSGEDLFEQALAGAEVEASYGKGDGKRVLLLHCNYDMEFACNDVTLNLSKKRAEQLLESFDRIIIGHDHNPKEDFDGRLIVLGNTHPTGFGDINNKRIAVYDSATGEIEFRPIWSADAEFHRYDAEQLLAADKVIAPGQFVEITGRIEATQALDLGRAVKALWNSDPAPFAIRVNVSLHKAGEELLLKSEANQLSVWDLIRAELQEAGQPELLELLDGLKVSQADALIEE